MLYVSGKGMALDCLKAVYRQTRNPEPPLDEMTCRSIIGSAIMEQFRESDPAIAGKKIKESRPLGLLAENLVLALTGSENEAITI